MFKAGRIAVLLFVLFFVSVSTWLSQARSTDWDNSLWVKIYPINGDGSDNSAKYIEGLDIDDFKGIESFIERETSRYASVVDRPVRVELGSPIRSQPPAIKDAPNTFNVMMWSLKMRWWAERPASSPSTRCDTDGSPVTPTPPSTSGC